MTLYHGTDYKQEILENGFQDVNYHPNGTYFGKGIYLTENLAYAGCFGDDILRVTIDESKLIIFENMDEYNSFCIKNLMFNPEIYFTGNPYIGFAIQSSDTVYIPYANKDCINIID